MQFYNLKKQFNKNEIFKNININNYFKRKVSKPVIKIKNLNHNKFLSTKALFNTNYFNKNIISDNYRNKQNTASKSKKYFNIKLKTTFNENKTYNKTQEYNKKIKKKVFKINNYKIDKIIINKIYKIKKNEELKKNLNFDLKIKNFN